MATVLPTGLSVYAYPSFRQVEVEQAAGSSDQSGRWIVLLVSALLLAMVFLQKLGPPAAGSHIELVLILTYALLAFLLLRQVVMISATRLCLLAVLLATMAISQWLSQQSWGLTAVLIVLALYCPFIFVLPVSRPNYLRILNSFQLAMLVICVIVALQQLVQFTIGARFWPNLSEILPSALQVPGYNYLRETAYESGIFMPNGVFFLEPSIVSQFFAIAIAVEIAWFRRWRLVAYVAGLLLTLAGSGLFVLAVASPFLLFPLGKRFLPLALAALVALLPVAQAVGWVDQIAARANEFGKPGSSGYIRYTQPIDDMVGRLTARPGQIVSGAGAGSTLADPGHNSLGLTKLVNEYGLLVALAFYAFIFACVFAGAPSLALAWAVFVYYSIGGGGLSVAIYALPLFYFAALMRIVPDGGEEAAEDAASLEDESGALYLNRSVPLGPR